MKKLIFLLLVVCASACTDKNLPSADQVISKMSDMSDLGTVEYSLTKIVMVNDIQWYAIGPRKILMECKAYVKAGIDFKQIKVIEINDSLKSIKLEIPDAKIIVVSIPPSEFKVVTSSVGALRSNFTHTEINEIQKLAEDDINKKILELNILNDAKRNGKLFLQNFLKNLGFQQIFITEPQILMPPIVLPE